MNIMRFKYFLYPKAKNKLESSGLLKRIEEANERNNLPFITHTMNSDVVREINNMKKRGYFDTLDEHERIIFQQKLQKAFVNNESHKWKVYRNEKVIEEIIEPEDFYLMTGFLSSFVLEKDEIWDYKKFGFDTINNFVGCMGTAIWSSESVDIRGGYKWTTKTSNGRIFENNISGDSNLDLRIYQTDITPDKTIDPTGIEVLYRPELDDDRKCVSAYHSTEEDFLVGVLKWINQEKISSDMIKFNGAPLINWTKSLGHRIGAAAECFGDFNTNSPLIKLNNFYDKIPSLDKNYSTEQRTFDGVSVGGNSFFGMYIGSNKELIFAYEKSDKIEKEKKPETIFYPSEADHLLKGICYQSAKGLGRTVPQKLISLIEYRFSGEMDRDIEEIRRK